MRSIILSESVASGENISYLFCSDGRWIAISEKDKETFYLDQEFGQYSQTISDYTISEGELYARIPILRGKLDEEEEKFITIEHKSGRVYVNPKHKTRSVFTGTSARATNQANFDVNAWTYIKNRKDHFLKILGNSLFLIWLSYHFSWGFLIFLFWYLFLRYFQTLASLDMYKMGTLNASMVVSINPMRIAVYTDLSKGLGKYPLVRICKMKLPKRYRILHARFPSSCGYNNCEDQDFWDYVMPNPLVFATNNEDAIQRKMAEIPTQDWLELKRWVKANKHNYYEGYYPIRDQSNNWDKYEEPIFSSFHEEERPR